MAKQKLEEAGYPDGIEIDFKVYAEEPWKTEGEILKEQFAEVGITANLTTVEQTSYHDVVLKQYDYELGQAGGGYVPVPGTVLNMYLHSSGFANYGGLSDPDMDALIEEFRVTWDEDRQYELYDEIMTYTMENVKPFIILCPHKASFFLMKDKVMGWKGQLNADFIFSHVWLAE
jgi:peptide/nickel transport system substrate-binding protein